jgi:multidrug efflux pump subunit AcrB
VNLLTLPIRRPVAVAMFFLAIVLVGAIAWQRMPVELLPALAGDRLFVTFARPGSAPQVVEREILIPLQARVSALPLVSETWAEIRGPAGRFEVQFEPGADLNVRTLELQRIAAELQRTQPQGTSVSVSSVDTSVLSSFAMIVNVLGAETDDRNAIHDLAEELVAPRFAAVPGISQALTSGGAPLQVTVTVDTDRTAALGVTTDAVVQSVRRNVDRLQYLGTLESAAGRLPYLNLWFSNTTR